MNIISLFLYEFFAKIIANFCRSFCKATVGLYQKDNTAIVVFRNKGDHLSKEKAEKLFDRFYRLDESRNTNTGGSGLGLAISKNIVELHEGKIWAESIGDNISFYVQLNL